MQVMVGDLDGQEIVSHTPLCNVGIVVRALGTTAIVPDID